MDYLVDTSVLVRALHPGDPHSATARQALQKLFARGDALCVVPQVIAELWAVATRLKSENGLGYSPARVNRWLSRYRRSFELRFETDLAFQAWWKLVVDKRVRGKQTHDARIAAAALAHGIGRILTFNTKHFERYDRIDVVHPADI